MAWMMGFGLLGWVLVIGLLVAILVVLIRLLNLPPAERQAQGRKDKPLH